jgi:GNAT superfamily N-acetyltransferase
MKIIEIDLKKPEDIYFNEIKEFELMIENWFEGALSEFHTDINSSDYCKLYLVQTENNSYAGGVVISNIILGQYSEAKEDVMRNLESLDENIYSYLMWFFVKPEFRGLGFGNELMKFVLDRYKKLCLETEEEKLAKHYSKFGFKEFSRNYDSKNSIFMSN